MADYRNAVDTQNNKNADVPSQLNKLAEFLNQREQFKAQQSQELLKQQLGHQYDIDKDTQKRSAEQKQLQEMMGSDNLGDAMAQATKHGQSVHMGDITVGQDPYSKLVQGNQKGLASAIATSNNQYMKSLPKLQGAAQKIHEGMALINDPKQVGSAGAAKSLIISGVAEMNRYNQQEGSDLVPTTSLQKLQQYANSMGDDKNPLSDAQRAAINHMFVGALGSLKQKHDVLRQSAIGTFETSPYYDAGRGEALKKSMGAPLDAQLNNDMQQYAKYGADQQMMSPPGQQSGPSGLLGKLKNLIMPKQAAPQPMGQPAPSVMPASAPGNEPGTTGTSDPIMDEINRRNALKQQQGR